MKIKPLIAACAMSLSTEQNRLVIIPDGEFRGVDGRPFDAPAWRLTAENAETIVAALSDLKIDLVIDYEHATLKALETGEPAPASGWLKPNGWESSMDELLEQLRWMLNLPLSANAEEILAELGKLQAQIKEKTGVTVAANDQHLFDALDAIEALKVAANAQTNVMPDPTQYVPMAVHQEALAQAAEVAANTQAKELDDLIVAACSDGRLTGKATIDWVKGLAETNPDGAKAYVEGLPKIAALTQQQTQQTPIAANNQQQAYTPEALEVARAMGLELPGANV